MKRKTNEQFLKELQQINPTIIPQKPYINRDTKIPCLCITHGVIWDAAPRTLLRGEECPECGKEKRGHSIRKTLLIKKGVSLQDEHPDLCTEWVKCIEHEEYTPSDVSSNSALHVLWKCKEYGHEWRATIYNRVSGKSGCPICSGHTVLPGFNDLQTKYPFIAAEWHPTKNLPKTANTISPFSNEKVWWICRFDHEYKCRIADRQKFGCSECSKRFRTSLPEKIVEYYVKQAVPNIISNYRPVFLNGAEIDIYIPDSVTGIEYDGQRYHQDIERDKNKDDLCKENGVRLIRIREHNCPVYERADTTYVLENEKNSSFSTIINSLLNDLSLQYDEVDVSEDLQQIMETYRNTAISGSIAEVYPELAKEWHPTLNGMLKPENIPATKSHDKYYWKCSEYGHTWRAVLYERIHGTGCPICDGKVILPGFNDLATTHPALAAEWHPTENHGKTPQMVSKGQNKSYWWKCSECGYEWPAKINKRVAGSGCEECENKKRGEKQSKKVYQFSLEGKLLKEYASARIAAEEMGVSRSLIQHVCTGTGRAKTAKGSYWSYYPNGKIKKDTKKPKKVLQYSLEGILIREYESAYIAAEEVGISKESIYHACNGTTGRKTAKGYIWKFKNQ